MCPSPTQLAHSSCFMKCSWSCSFIPFFGAVSGSVDFGAQLEIYDIAYVTGSPDALLSYNRKLIFRFDIK